MKRRYRAHQEPSGTWSILDTRPERPTEKTNRIVTGLIKEDAFDTAELFNGLENQRPAYAERKQPE